MKNENGELVTCGRSSPKRGHSWQVSYRLRGNLTRVHIWAATLDAAKARAWALYWWAKRLEVHDGERVHIVTGPPATDSSRPNPA